jgi:uncharacterized protein with PIN domain
MKQNDDEKIICEKCQLPLTRAKTKLMYQGIKFEAELSRCPKCGQTFVSEDLALGRMHELEIEMEDK